jgi:single-stranded-DNA-specific exonuclease
MLAFELLATNDIARAKEIVAELTQINDERKKLVARIVKEARARLDARELPDVVVIGDLTWRPAVLGLVANKLQEHYGKSFFVWGESGDGIIKGSCRMISIHHAAELMQALPEGAVLHAGGHQAAGGFAVAKDQIHFFEQLLNEALETGTAEEESFAENTVLALPLAIATARHYEALRALAPFGVGNPEPVFLFEDVEIVSAKKFGKTKEHLECTIRDATGTATAFTFFAPDSLAAACVPGAIVSVSASLEPGYRSGVRLHIKEIF